MNNSFSIPVFKLNNRENSFNDFIEYLNKYKSIIPLDAKIAISGWSIEMIAQDTFKRKDLLSGKYPIIQLIKRLIPQSFNNVNIVYVIPEKHNKSTLTVKDIHVFNSIKNKNYRLLRLVSTYIDYETDIDFYNIAYLQEENIVVLTM